MTEQIIAIILDQLHCDADTATESALLAEDLGADSLDLVEILMTIEENFGVVVPDEDIPSFKTVGDIVSYVEANM